MIQRVVEGRILLIPLKDGIGYAFRATTRYSRLFTGIAVPLPNYMTGGSRGMEHIRPEDSMDAAYGKLLEKSREKR